jgi:hypothetical protein
MKWNQMTYHFDMNKVEKHEIDKMEVGEIKYIDENIYSQAYSYFKKKGEDRQFSFVKIHPDPLTGNKTVQVKRLL